MSYFRHALNELTGDYGHLAGTMTRNTLSELQKHDAFRAIGDILSCKKYIEDLVDGITSIRKHCSLIDEMLGSGHLQRIDKTRNTLRSEVSDTLDLIMKHTLRKEYDFAIELLDKFNSQLGSCTEDFMELAVLQESFDFSKLPLDYVEFFETGEMRFIGRIFLSYSMKAENTEIVELTVAPFLEELGFQTVYAKKDFPPTKTPGQSAEEFIRKCGTLVAFLTKDQDSYPSANVIHEIGIASDKTIIMLVENGARVPTNLMTRGTYVTFERQQLERMLLELLKCLRLSNVFRKPRPF